MQQQQTENYQPSLRNRNDEIDDITVYDVNSAGNQRSGGGASRAPYDYRMGNEEDRES